MNGRNDKSTKYKYRPVLENDFLKRILNLFKRPAIKELCFNLSSTYSILPGCLPKNLSTYLYFVLS